MVLLKRRSLLALALAAVLSMPEWASPGLANAAEPAADLESEVKAAFLYNFAKFIEWPPEAFPAPSAPMTFCVYGEEPAGAALEASLGALLRGETLNGRRLAVRRLHDLPQLRECQVLFIGAAEKGHLPEVLTALGEASALTVGEGTDFLDKGGMIRLFLEQNRMRFDINLEAAEKRALRISSKLLRLAQTVKPQRRGV
jgi:YfiR/HmsC-like